MTTTIDAPPVRPADAAAAGMLPRKSFAFELKEAGDDSGEFELYAAIFGNRDRDGDIIEPGAFDNLAEFTEDGWGALNHRGLDLPVGYILEASQDARGLKVRGCFHSHAAAQACRSVVIERTKAGKRVLCSIGYVTRDESFERVEGQPTRRIKRLSVYEVSFVNIPANPQAAVISAKGKGAEPMPESKAKPPAETKSGRAISEANRKKIGEFADRMEEHHEKMAGCVKSMRDCHKAMKATHEAFKSYMKSFEGDADGDDDEDEDESPRGGKAAKNEKPEDSSDGDPPKSLSREGIGRKLAALKRPA